MNLFAPLARVFEAAAYRGCHAGLRRFMEDLDSVESRPDAHTPPTLAPSHDRPADAKLGTPPLTDFVRRLQLSPAEQDEKKPIDETTSRTKKPRKRPNNDQLG